MNNLKEKEKSPLTGRMRKITAADGSPLKFDGEYNITGRGTALTLSFAENGLDDSRKSTEGWMNSIIDYKGKEYIIRGIEIHMSMHPKNVAILIRELNQTEQELWDQQKPNQ